MIVYPEMTSAPGLYCRSLHVDQYFVNRKNRIEELECEVLDRKEDLK